MNNYTIRILCEQSLNLACGIKRKKEKIKALEEELTEENEVLKSMAINSCDVLTTLSMFPEEDVKEIMDEMKQRPLFKHLDEGEE